MQKYIEIATGMPNHQGICIPTTELWNKMRQCQANNMELYRSFFNYDKRLQEHMRTRKSPSGFIGDMSVDTLVLDIDRAKNTDEFVLQRARLFLEKLMEEWKLEDEIQPWFSGTGYHFVLPDIFGFKPQPKLNVIVKETIDTYFPEADTSFHSQTGLIRVGYTVNNKSGLYKTPLSIEELNTLTVEEIHELASKPRMDFQVKRMTPTVTFPDLIQTERHIEQKNVIAKDSPSQIVTCVQRMYNKGEEVGHRHTRIMRMTSAWRRAGVPMKAVIDVMKAYAPNMDAYEAEKHVTDTYNKGYMYGCEDKVMKEFCSPTCHHYKNKDYAPKIVSGKDLEREYVQFARTDFAERAFNLKDYWDIEEDFWIYPGYYVNLYGGTGRNKTALFQNLAVQLKRYAPILYLSTEFSNLLLFRRFTQIAHDMSKDQVLRYYQANTNTLSNAFSHIHYLKVVPNYAELRKLVQQFLPKIVVIDTIDDLEYYKDGQRLDGLEKEKAIAFGMKRMAEDLDIIVMCVHHVRKGATERKYIDHETGSSVEIEMPLQLEDGLGSGAFNQKADVVIGIEGKQKQNHRHVKIMKARDDEMFDIDFTFNVNTFVFTQMPRKKRKVLAS